MANHGLFADFGRAGAVEEQRRALFKQQQQQFQRLANQAQNRRQKAAGNLVEGVVELGQAGAFGDKLKGRLTPTSPELEQAQAEADFVKEVSQFEEDPTSSAYSERVADLAKERGRDDIALRALIQGGERKKVEEAAATEAAAAERKGQLAELRAFPEGVKMEVYAQRPELLKEVVKDPRARVKIAEGIKEMISFKKAAAAKDAADVKRSTATKVSGADLKATSAIVDQLTQSQFTGSTELETVSTLVADRAQTNANTIRDAGGTVDMTALRTEAFAELTQEGTIEHTLGSEYLGGSVIVGEKLGINREKLTATPVAPTQPSTASPRRRVVAKPR